MHTGNTWVEIDLDQIEKNFRAIQKKAAPARVNCVIKANAYGHGSVQVGKHLEPLTDYFSVANFTELKELRRHSIRKPILCLGYVDPEDYAAFPEYAPEITVYHERQAEKLSEAMTGLSLRGAAPWSCSRRSPRPASSPPGRPARHRCAL